MVHSEIALSALRLLFGERYARQFGVRLWDGTSVPAAERSRFVFVVNDPGALRAALRPPVDLSAGRAFAAGLIDVEGDVEGAVDEIAEAAAHLGSLRAAALALRLRQLPLAALPELREAHLRGRRNSRARDRAAIGFHYDQPIAFYRAFLDERLVYSCAYFDDGVTTLAEAQLAKIDYTLRKLRLRPGERLLDVG